MLFVTENLIDVFTKEKARDISSEESLLRRINDLLTQKDLPALSEMTAKMISVNENPDSCSRIITYLAEGSVVSVRGDRGEWSKLVLLSGGIGYVSSRNLTPAPNTTVSLKHK